MISEEELVEFLMECFKDGDICSQVAEEFEFYKHGDSALFRYAEAYIVLPRLARKILQKIETYKPPSGIEPSDPKQMLVAVLEAKKDV